MDTSVTAATRGVLQPRIISLSVDNFRSHTHVRIEARESLIVLYGPNGAGKTNLLEAISLFSPTRGMRGAEARALGRQTGDAPPLPWAVSMGLEDGKERVTLGTGIVSATDKRAVRIDGKNMSSRAAFLELVDIQWLSPRMDRLFLESASERRRFVDRLVFAYDAAHVGRLRAVENATRERLRLLKSGAGDNRWLTALEATVAGKSITVAAARMHCIETLNRFCACPSGPFPAMRLLMEGDIETWLAEGPALAAEERLKERLFEERSMDAARGHTHSGQHKSDLKAHHLERDKDAAGCSTGEQKILLVGMILADARMAAFEKGRVPILLLDEVTAHLDREHRMALFSEIESIGAQAWMSGTERELFAPIHDRAAFFSVRNGEIVRDDGPQ